LSSKTKTITVTWIVGGSIVINSTQLWHAKWDDVPELNCLSQPSQDIVDKMEPGKMVSSSSGGGRFGSKVEPTKFSATFDISSPSKKYQVGDDIVILISAVVDTEWTGNTAASGPKVAPQSHAVNARTSTLWCYNNSKEYIVKGRTLWFSGPATVKIT
jgi:hypothetical protein